MAQFQWNFMVTKNCPFSLSIVLGFSDFIQGEAYIWLVLKATTVIYTIPTLKYRMPLGLTAHQLSGGQIRHVVAYCNPSLKLY